MDALSDVEYFEEEMICSSVESNIDFEVKDSYKP